jgi:hypothetical protein
MIPALASFVTRVGHIGFYGLDGFLGAIVGLVVALIIIWAIWSIFEIIAKQFFGGAMNWAFQVIRIILIAAIAIWFIETVFSLF